MFPQEDTQFMYPTRIPFEESTVYSQINIKSPNLNKFSEFKVILNLSRKNQAKFENIE